MPRTTTLDCPGCPPLRALTFDELGLIKVIEARGKQGRAEPKVVERWGDPDSSKCVLAASIDDRKSDPLLAVARRNGMVEVLNPLNGDLRFAVSNASINGVQSEDDPVAGLHLFAKKKSELASRSCTLLTCTTNGNASIRSFEVNKPAADVASTGSSRTWIVGGGGSILCSKVDGSENYFLFGGKRVEMNVWDLDSCAKIWTAKPPPKNSLGIFTPTWFTSATFLSKDDHRKFVAGTNSHEVRLYDISAQRRPVISFDFRETAIKSVAEDLDGYTIYVGNGSGDLASFDIRTGKLLGCFLGKCSGSIRSIARHPEFPVIASCGLDSYLRLWNVKTRQLLSAVHLKQHLTNVLFDSNFADEEIAHSAADWPLHEERDEGETPPLKRKKSKEKKGIKKEAEAKSGNKDDERDEPLHEDERDESETPPVKRKKSKEKKGIKKEAEAKSGNKESSEEYGGKKVKSKKSSKRLEM
ncbi:PREDICTED: WD repeat-containing protein DDB_G0290555 isoform X2 [Prunus mume]|uniref:WD repeat-containing protein DDB_G0290555 isoform X2 n=1 Tax=Prunus mume TaxID=102107 RepID=A0ABM0N2R6_PRUMU|nr:PREDICTED: WD repeat-containing protein DDB_G0290555 isoform X2 [Prunus mume]